MAIEGIISSPSVIKVRTDDNKEHYLNSNMVVAYSPSLDNEKMTDIVMLNGQVFTVKETPSQLIENRYRRDANRGASIFNLIA